MNLWLCPHRLLRCLPPRIVCFVFLLLGAAVSSERQERQLREAIVLHTRAVETEASECRLATSAPTSCWLGQ